MSIGQRIVKLRKTLGLSQYQLAKLMDVSRQAVSKWETDQTSPDSMNLIHLAEILKTDIDYLTTGRRPDTGAKAMVITKTETVEKPVVQVVETVVEKIVEKPVVQFIEKPVTKKVYRNVYVRNPIEFAIFGIGCCVLGFLIGLLF